MKKNKDLIKVFEDTKEMTKMFYLHSDTSVHDDHEVGREASAGKIDVIDMDTVSCLIEESYYGGKICVLNMASKKKAGGGVETGQKAQEEDLFRCSNLWRLIDEEFYPLDDDELLYTTNAEFIKDSKYNLLKTSISCDVISVPAINLNSKSYYDKEKEEWIDKIEEKPEGYEDSMKRKIRSMFNCAWKHGCDTIILGAWGCGVFKNKPEDVAQFFKEVIEEDNVLYRFRRVVFAVINDKNSRGDNFGVFYETLYR